MRLLKLRIENVNSLGGVHEIDFRAPEFRESGIFAICGPTGSGKTSILDAVTLALYGTTPRMEERAQTAKKDDACMVLTKNTDQTSAQVTFESFGAVYRSRWSRRVKRTGKISGDEVELVRLASPDAVEGEIIAEQKSEWKLALERILGMNLKAFTRSAMLAQGAFAELLRANNRDRADILEKITGTEIYTLIGARVFERMTEEKEKKVLLEERMRSVEVLSDEDRSSAEADLQKTKAEAESFSKALQELKLDIAWSTSLIEARSRKARADHELESLEAEREKLQGERTRAADARRAAEPAQIISVREKALAEASLHGKNAEKFASEAQEAKGRADVLEKSVREAEAAEKHAGDRLQNAEPELRQIEAMDKLIEVLELRSDEALKRMKNAERRLALSEREAGALGEAEGKAKEEEERLLEVMKTRAPDEPLVADASLFVEQAKEAQKLSLELGRDREGLAALEKELKKYSLSRERKREDADREEKALEVLRGEVAQAQREAGIAFSGNALSQKIAETRELTGKLWAKDWLLETDALLGFAPGMPPEALKVLEERRQKLLRDWGSLEKESREALEARLDGVEGWSLEAGAAQEALEDLQKREKEKEAEVQNANRAAMRADEAFVQKSADVRAKNELLGEKEKDVAARFDTLQTRMAAYMQEDWRLTDAVADAELLLRRSQAVREAHEALQRARVQAASASARRIEADKKTAELALDRKEARTLFEEASARLNQQSAERKERFGERNPKAEREALQTKLSECIRMTRKTGTLHQEAVQSLQAAAIKREAEEKARSEYESAAADAAAALEEALQKAGFANEKEVKSAFLPREAVEALEAEIRAHDLRRAGAQKEAQNAREAEEKLLEAPRRDCPLEGLAAEEAEADEKMKAALELKGSLEARLHADDDARSKARDAAEALGKAEKTVLLWTRLNALIGSKDGARFRQAAQKLTFELLLHEANLILRQMQSRYELIARGENGLDLAVRDLELAGIERTSFNLSGGETFMVSLALALSLSRISTNRMRVDTLFLDEGFGSLDPVSLSKALNALEMLQQTSGKLIGLISHVPAVRERVGVQITVKPRGSSGLSDISGPGVRRLERD